MFLKYIWCKQDEVGPGCAMNPMTEPPQAPLGKVAMSLEACMFFYFMSALHVRPVSIFVGFSLLAHKTPIRVFWTDVEVQMMEKIRCLICVRANTLVLYEAAQLKTNRAKSKCALH